MRTLSISASTPALSSSLALAYSKVRPCCLSSSPRSPPIQPLFPKTKNFCAGPEGQHLCGHLDHKASWTGWAGLGPSGNLNSWRGMRTCALWLPLPLAAVPFCDTMAQVYLGDQEVGCSSVSSRPGSSNLTACRDGRDVSSRLSHLALPDCPARTLCIRRKHHMVVALLWTSSADLDTTRALGRLRTSRRDSQAFA